MLCVILHCVAARGAGQLLRVSAGIHTAVKTRVHSHIIFPLTIIEDSYGRGAHQPLGLRE